MKTPQTEPLLVTENPFDILKNIAEKKLEVSGCCFSFFISQTELGKINQFLQGDLKRIEGEPNEPQDKTKSLIQTIRFELDKNRSGVFHRCLMSITETEEYKKYNAAIYRQGVRVMPGFNEPDAI